MASAQVISEAPVKSVSTKPSSGASAWKEFAQSMIQAAMHSVCLHPEDGLTLQKALVNALEQLKGEPADDLIRRQGQEVAAAVDQHNRTTQQATTAVMAELRETVAALSQGLRSLTSQGEVATHVEALQSIITSAQTPQDLEAGRSQVEELIELIAQKERDRISRYEEFVQELQDRIEQLESAKEQSSSRAAHDLAAQAPTIDMLTGVPNAVAAREAILHAQSSERPPHVAIIHIQSLDVLNARFGQRIGDQIVLTCCQHLASNLCRENDRIFRWRGPAFVVLLDRDDSPAGVSREVSHVCNSIASSFFGEPHRSILIPVKMASASIPLESRLITDVFDSIERFIVRAGRPMA